jgi:hypothetical protein
MRAVCRTAWTTLMFRKLRERFPGCRTKADRLALAAELGVTFYALKHKLQELKLRKQPPWRPEDDRYILENYGRGKVSAKMAALWVGRTEGAVRSHAQQLKRKLKRQAT